MARNFVILVIIATAFAGCSVAPFSLRPDQGKLLATGGVSQVEGAGGAGLAPWAMITGYGSDASVGGNTYYTHTKTNDFELRSYGTAIGIADRMEVSYARQEFDTNEAGQRLGLRSNYTFKQDILGAKLRVAGDAVYGQDSLMPQIAVGMQYKKVNSDNAGLVSALGAKDNDGVDIYTSATKLFLDKNLILNATLRGTKANQFGLLGFGGDKSDKRSLQFEGSAAYMLNRKLVVGADYRTKPNNLNFAEESDATAAYVAFFPNKNMSITLAGVDMGKVAAQGRQRGLYLSTQVGF